MKNRLSGYGLLNDPLLNKGTAFTQEERTLFQLHGLLPANVATFEEQISRRIEILHAFETDLEKYAFLRELQDTNEVLFYGLLVRYLQECLPLVYTPTVGQGCQEFSHIYRRPRGLFLTPLDVDRLDEILANPRFDQTEAIVVSDGERILGLGDQGAGGMGIPIGKLALYTGCGGIHPATTLPILLDVGTNNNERLNDPLYIGWHHERITGEEYDHFLEEFVEAVHRRWPNILLQFEDFARHHAAILLERYRDRLCTFNDDIQGTAAVATGTLLAAIQAAGETMAQQKIVFFGAGSAGCGIAGLMHQAIIESGVDAEKASSQIFLIDSDGLLLEDAKNVTTEQRPFLIPKNTVKNWHLDKPGNILLLDVIRNAKPTVLIGVSGQAGAFTEQIVREMAKNVEKPAIFPLSNPTSHAEATPADLLKWTDYRAVIGTGSPFAPIEYHGKIHHIDQTNNAYIFPGVALGVIAVKARRVSNEMFMTAAKTLASLSPARLQPEGNLLPPISALREVALAVALAVARQAHKEGLTDIAVDDIDEAVHKKMWTPGYPSFEKAHS